VAYELQLRLVKKGAQGPLDEGLDVLYESAEVRVPKRSAEEIVIDASMNFDSFYADRQAEGGDGSGSILVGSVAVAMSMPPLPGPGRIQVGMR